MGTETASDDDALDMSDDDFFLSGSSSDEAEADDEWTDKSTRYAVLCLCIITRAFDMDTIISLVSCYAPHQFQLTTGYV